MMISNLPRDLVEEIVSRVPLKSMKAVQLTCRAWNTLSKSQISTFTKMHIGKASAATKEGESLMIVMMDQNLYLMSVSLNKDVGPFTEHKGKLTCLNEQVKISQVFQCDGLLLCILKDDDTKVVVWNPYWAQTRWIELRFSLRPLKYAMNYFSYSLGYVNKKSCRSYKFLRFVDVSLFEGGNKFSWYEIYDFDSDSWTTLDVTPFWHLNSKYGLSLKGNTYWCVSKMTNGSWDEYPDHIICFDYTTERFGRLHTLPSSIYWKRFVSLSCVREEKLAVLFQLKDVDVGEIWITTMIEAENVSWSKFLKLDTPIPSHPCTWYSIWSFFIDEMTKVAIVLDRYTVSVVGEAGYLRQVDLKKGTEEFCMSHTFSYAPSLVQIKQPKGGQRKNQSNVEKLRYDQYMLRLSFFISRCIKLADQQKLQF